MKNWREQDAAMGRALLRIRALEEMPRRVYQVPPDHRRRALRRVPGQTGLHRPPQAGADTGQHHRPGHQPVLLQPRVCLQGLPRSVRRARRCKSSDAKNFLRRCRRPDPPRRARPGRRLNHRTPYLGRIRRPFTRPPYKSAAISNLRARADRRQKSREKEAVFVANRQEKTKEQRIRAEKTRLRRIYKLLPKEAAGTVAGLIDQAAFMRIECEDMADDLRENGWTEKFQQSERLEPYDRARPIGQAYNSTNANYQKIIKQLTALLPKPDTAQKQEDDGFASFVRERDEE
nr:MAG TPA: hypothetical protein [Caudoviricetes sp.]